MSNYTIKRTNLRNAETADVITEIKRAELLRQIRSNVINQPRWLQDYDKNLTEQENYLHRAMMTGKVDAMINYQHNVTEMENEYIARWEEYQDDLEWLKDTRNDCSCFDGSCLYCRTIERVKR